MAVPAKLFGRWKTLRGKHRVKSRHLLRVYRELQEMMSAKYDLAELQMEEPDEFTEEVYAQTMDKVFLIERASALPIAIELTGLINKVRVWAKSHTLTIILDDEQAVREYSAEADKHKWVMTHLPGIRNDKDRRLEREMKTNFFEHSGRVHITTVDCAQGRTFENVVFVITRDATPGKVEEAFTGFTRASRHLYVIDASESKWAYSMMSRHGIGDFLWLVKCF